MKRQQLLFFAKFFANIFVIFLFAWKLRKWENKSFRFNCTWKTLALYGKLIISPPPSSLLPLPPSPSLVASRKTKKAPPASSSRWKREWPMCVCKCDPDTTCDPWLCRVTHTHTHIHRLDKQRDETPSPPPSPQSIPGTSPIIFFLRKTWGTIFWVKKWRTVWSPLEGWTMTVIYPNIGTADDSDKAWQHKGLRRMCLGRSCAL